MNISGKARLKTTVEGLRNIATKLARVIANIAFTWLYFPFINLIESAKLS
jgi:hypothetical protein